jgi:negative regulator of sigma E activity
MNRERDAELSALLDDALSGAAASALREELARDPALAARLEELAHVDAALRALPARPLPTDLRARLQQRIDAEPRGAQPARERAAHAPRRPRALAPRRRGWALGFATAASVAALGFVLVPIFREQEAATRVAQSQPAPLPGEPPVSGAETTLAAAETHVPTPEISRAGDPPRTEPTDLAASDALQTGAQSPVAAVAETLAALEGAAEQPNEGAVRDVAVAAIEPAATSAEPLLSEAEAEALEGLELEDASVVAVLDLLGALGDLEEGAS